VSIVSKVVGGVENPVRMERRRENIKNGIRSIVYRFEGQDIIEKRVLADWVELNMSYLMVQNEKGQFKIKGHEGLLAEYTTTVMQHVTMMSSTLSHMLHLDSDSNSWLFERPSRIIDNWKQNKKSEASEEARLLHIFKNGRNCHHTFAMK
jgi:hypothetical protein